MHLSQHAHLGCPKKNGAGEWELNLTSKSTVMIKEIRGG